MRGNRASAMVVTRPASDATDTCPLNRSTHTKSVSGAGDLSIIYPETGYVQELTGAYNVRHGLMYNGTCTKRVTNTPIERDALRVPLNRAEAPI